MKQSHTLSHALSGPLSHAFSGSVAPFPGSVSGAPNRLLQPMEFIERWSLCHHLACVVKYTTQAAQKTSSLLKDLKSAQWYLARELSCPYKPSFSSRAEPFVQKIALEGYKLPFHVEQMLFHLQVSQKVHQYAYMREASLKQAMKHLSEEIKIHEH